MTSDSSGREGPLPLDLLDRGDLAFVDAVRAIHDAKVLADFAQPWFLDSRPDSRKLLLDYLTRPLNAYRHEGFIKRLFKLAEAVGDDPVMARFLVLFDRSIRRVRRKRFQYVNQMVDTAQAAESLKRTWLELGYLSVNSYAHRGRYNVYGYFSNEAILQTRSTTMPREEGDLSLARGVSGRRLFTVATRRYLRRRSWRYFRKLGKRHPERYTWAVSEALALYTNEDVTDGLAMLDNWGLMHALFAGNPVLIARPTGWVLGNGRSIAELTPAPAFEPLWAGSFEALVSLMARARCQTVTRWAVRRLEKDSSRALAACPLERWVELLGHDDPEVSDLANRLLQGAEGLEAIGVDRWLRLVDSSSPEAQGVVCGLVGRYVPADQVTFEDASRLAVGRSLAVARLGFSWLRAKVPVPPEAHLAILGLLEAGCRPLRPEILRWVRANATTAPNSVLAFLDSRHDDARLEGWQWFRAEPIFRDDVSLWEKLLESPHDDIQLALVADLESRRADSLETGSLLGLWASVLLNIRRGARSRPSVVRQVVQRLEARPSEAPKLLPLLSLAVRSVRGPERRAGLVAVVQLLERRSEVEPLVRSAFPELQWT